MGFHAKSLTLKKRELQAKKSAQLELALQAYKRELEQPPELRLGLRRIAEQYPGVAYSTLWRRTQGQRTIQEFNASKQKLTSAEEEVLVQLIETSADWSNPLTHASIAEFANEILRRRGENSFEPVGINWVNRFAERHRNRVKTYWSKSLETQRAESLNPHNVSHWFDLIKQEIVDKGILPENIYGMDESGFPPSNQGTQRVFGRVGNKVQHKQGSGNRENATGLIGICADGSILQPLIVFKSQRLHLNWFENNVADAA